MQPDLKSVGTLSQLAAGLPEGMLIELSAGADPVISGIALDSRQVQQGELFVALSPKLEDQRRYIQDALSKGAAAVAGTAPRADLSPEAQFTAPYLQVSHARLALAYFSAAFYDFPARKLTVIGVTGTDGKTTTSNLLYEVLRAAGIRAGMISTVNALIGEQALDTGFHVTTPEAPDVQRYLYQMVQAGLTHVILEATSHGLAQDRVAACDFDLGVVTNITHEHLDYHGSYEAYQAAKSKLFASLPSGAEKPFGVEKGAILNRDDQSYAYLPQVVEQAQTQAGRGVRILTYGRDPQADVRAVDIQHHPDSIRFSVEGPGFAFPVRTPLVGAYNVSNCLAAIAAGVGLLGVSPEAAQAGIANLKGVPGRMERIDLGQDFTALVDFAHTPNALKNALESIREVFPGARVIAVFGSAGLRDRAKRRMMAETSSEMADLTVLTAEDPRTESLDNILAEMAAGAVSRGGVEGETFWRVPDRGDAIRFGMRLARPGDVVVALGKGHEQSMCFIETEYAWDDRTAMRAALAELLGVPGPEMPYLPTQTRADGVNGLGADESG